MNRRLAIATAAIVAVSIAIVVVWHNRDDDRVHVATYAALQAVAPMSDGGAVVAGYGGDGGAALVRFGDDGAVDGGFGDDGVARYPVEYFTSAEVLALTVEDDRIRVALEITDDEYEPLNVTVADFDFDGELRATYEYDLPVPACGVRDAAFLDGDVLALLSTAGASGPCSGGVLVRLGASGRAWSPPGRMELDGFPRFTLTAKGSIIVAGRTSRGGFVWRLTADGSPAPGFGDGGVAEGGGLDALERVTDVVVRRDGSSIVLGDIPGMPGESLPAVVNLTASGAVSEAFAIPVFGWYFEVDTAVLDGGAVLLATRDWIARVGPDGRLTAFRDGTALRRWYRPGGMAMLAHGDDVWLFFTDEGAFAQARLDPDQPA